jgi:hypothetical protein
MRSVFVSLILGCALAASVVLSMQGGAAALASPPAASGAAGTVRYVAPGAACGGAEPCYAAIQAAVDAAGEGDEIRVAGGTYTGAGSEVVRVEKSLTIRGGYTVADWVDADPNLNPTFLDGEDDWPVIEIVDTVDPRGDVTVTIEGLRIVRGDALWGGGVYVADAAVTLHHNWITDNRAQRGGGLYAKSHALTLTRNVIQGNQATSGGFDAYGGGVYVRDCDRAVLMDNRVISNTVQALTGRGGGIYLRRSSAVLTDNVIQANEASVMGEGGGLYVDASTAALNRNTIADNGALDYGGGLYLTGSAVVLTNTLIVENLANDLGSGLFAASSQSQLIHTTLARNRGVVGSGLSLSEGSQAALTNTILVSHSVGIVVAEGSTATLAATLWGTGTWANEADWGGSGVVMTGAVTGNYRTLPAFVAPDEGNYHLTQSSGAVDQGLDAAVSLDIDGHRRPIGDGFDLGADEWAASAYLPMAVRAH